MHSLVKVSFLGSFTYLRGLHTESSSSGKRVENSRDSRPSIHQLHYIAIYEYVKNKQS